eukprot:gene13983-15441_t
MSASSRLIVKNLPKDITKEKLIELFSSHGELTDLRLCKTKSGEFRKFAFVGFKREKEAANALKTLNKSYIKTSKIQIEIAKNIGDESVPRPWSKYSSKSSAFERSAKEKDERKKRIRELQEGTTIISDELKDSKAKAEENVNRNPKNTENDNEELSEFLKVHEKTSQKKTWDNEMADTSQHITDASKNKKNSKRKTVKDKGKTKENKEESSTSNIHEDETSDEDSDTESEKDSDEDSDVDSEEVSNGEQSKNISLTVKMRGIPFKCKEKDIIDFFTPLRITDIRIPLNSENKAKGSAYVDFQDENTLLEGMKKNKQNIKGRYIELFRMEADKSFAESNQEEESMPWDKKNVYNEGEEEEPAEDSGRLFIRNLSYTCEESEIKELFQTHGPIAEVHLPIDKTTKRVTGIGFVTFVMPEHAVKALNELDGTVFQGRLLHVLPARTKRVTPSDQYSSDSKSSYKKEKDAKVKSLSGSGHNWNTLFLGQNAVVDVLAEKMNASKSAILDTEKSDSLAVRMALGETQIVAETREFLTSNGVKLDAFGQSATKKSDTVILVKNLPQGTKIEELRDLFGRFGDVDRLLLPPSGVTAIIEFMQPTEARTAFRSLAYTKFKHLPLYLEWAPVDVFKGEIIIKEADKEADKEAEAEDEVKDTGENKICTIFVKNLNFSTTEDKLEKLFEKCGEVVTVTVARKKDPKKPNEMLSMGYGFVEFARSADADEAMKTLQHAMLEDHQLELKKSHRKSQLISKLSYLLRNQNENKRKSVSKKQKTSKILVRNIPFEATKKEVQQLFGAFGEIKTLRLPKKMTGSHRGFAFVDFLTKQDAKRAFKALCQSTHLYGRRLVLEWAEEDDTVDSIRQRTAMHFHDEPAKKRGKRDVMETLENPAPKTGNL